MHVFLQLPSSENDFRNPRINMDHVKGYRYEQSEDRIIFYMLDGTNEELNLLNLKAEKIIKKIDSLFKVVKFNLTKADMV